MHINICQRHTVCGNKNLITFQSHLHLIFFISTFNYISNLIEIFPIKRLEILAHISQHGDKNQLIWLWLLVLNQFKMYRIFISVWMQVAKQWLSLSICPENPWMMKYVYDKVDCIYEEMWRHIDIKYASDWEHRDDGFVVCNWKGSFRFRYFNLSYKIWRASMLTNFILHVKHFHIEKRPDT